MVYLITDTMLGDASMCQRHGRPAGFSELILRNWQEMVHDDDDIIHLGDVAADTRWLKRIEEMPGRKALVMGDRDKFRQDTYLKAGFTFIEQGETTINIDDMWILLSHKPSYDYGKREGSTYFYHCWNIYGHQMDLHRDEVFHPHLPISLEHTGYKPFALDDRNLKILRWLLEEKHPLTLRDIVAMHRGSMQNVQERDLWQGHSARFTALYFITAGVAFRLTPDQVVHWQLKQDTFYLVLRECAIDIGSLHGSRGYIEIDYGDGVEARYEIDLQGIVAEHFGPYTMLWIPAYRNRRW